MQLIEYILMKPIYGAIVSLALFATTVAAQEQVIDESTFNAGMRRSQRPVSEWQGKARRILKTTEEEFSNLPGMDHTYKDVTEYDATGSSRSRWKAITGNRGRKGEIVSIGNLVYKQNGIEKWTSEEVPTSGIPQPVLPFESNNRVDPKSYSSVREPGSSVEFKLRTDTHKGETALVYRRVVRLTVIDPKNGSEIGRETIDHYWISAQGRLVKLEQWINHNGKDFYGRQKVAMEWELAPSIVIDPPLLAPKTQ